MGAEKSKLINQKRTAHRVNLGGHKYDSRDARQVGSSQTIAYDIRIIDAQVVVLFCLHVALFL